MHRLHRQQEAEQVKGTPGEHRQMDMSGHGKYLSEQGQDGEVTVIVVVLSLLSLSHHHCHHCHVVAVVIVAVVVIALSLSLCCCCFCHVHLTLLVHTGMLDRGRVQAGHLASPVMPSV